MSEYRFDGLPEFISRRTRVRLLELINGKLGSLSVIAERLGVSRWAVCKWFDPSEAHPNNQNTRKIIELAIRLDRIGTREILLDEALEYLELVRSRFNENYSANNF
ncbi:hypothetical protein AKJ48_03170 [candidate division MSBL1 archaeon SCGC-AAA261O19]|uniref:HTH cro/C1-type domain-containing protein n=1 Tax=candidate division MSBL1 archaeon SCGC-AAA261O19 TaxID=1698277 RepID=A0A133VCU4_9EURY|nr:hypothetical protein AKJ48_03170 [candidate division MSBL1 archaeon SCGC-AAA261O19]